MLYESLKHSISEYNKKHKKDESLEEKAIFKWKIATLGLCILAIVMIGILSQLYKQIQQKQPYQFNANFFPTLLSQSNQLNTISQIKNFMLGFKDSTPKIQFSQIQFVYRGNTLNSSLINGLINGKSNLLYIWEFQNPIIADPPLKFSFYFKKSFQDQIPTNTQIQIIQPVADKSSSIFNLVEIQSLRLNLVQNCALYSYAKNQNLSIFGQFLRFNQNSASNIDILLRNWRCFGQTQTQAMTKFSFLTGIQIFDINETRTFTLTNVQIFKLIPLQQ